MPKMGSLQCAIVFVVDMHDNENMPYSLLQTLYTLSNGVTTDKIKDIKIVFGPMKPTPTLFVPIHLRDGFASSARAAEAAPTIHSRSGYSPP